MSLITSTEVDTELEALLRVEAAGRQEADNFLRAAEAGDGEYAVTFVRNPEDEDRPNVLALPRDAHPAFFDRLDLLTHPATTPSAQRTIGAITLYGWKDGRGVNYHARKWGDSEEDVPEKVRFIPTRTEKRQFEALLALCLRAAGLR